MAALWHPRHATKVQAGLLRSTEGMGPIPTSPPVVIPADAGTQLAAGACCAMGPCFRRMTSSAEAELCVTANAPPVQGAQ